MIEYLRGTLLRVEEDHVVLDVNGVGYGLDIPASTRERLSEPGEAAAFHVAMVVREDALELYGFATPEERRVFEIFLGVSGIGPRTALDVLSTLSIREFVSAVRFGHVQELTRIPGIGRKKAERLIVELKDRLQNFPTGTEPAESGGPDGEKAASSRGEARLFDDAAAALQALGYKPAEAARCVSAALRSMERADVSVEELVKQALQINR